jgi:hypothetical protein
MSSRKKNLTLSFSIGEGYNRDIKKEFVSIDEGIRELEHDLKSKYGYELSSYLNGTKQKKEINKAVNRR